MPSTPPEYVANTGCAGTGRWLGRWVRCACRLTPARAERTHATSAMRKSRFFWASLKTPCDRERQYKVCESMATRSAGGPCWFATCRVTATVRRPLDALDHIRPRHIRQSAPAMTRSSPPQCGQTERSIAPVRITNGMLIAMQSAEHPELALHPGHGCRGSVVVGFAVRCAQRMSADLRVAATLPTWRGWDNLASMPRVRGPQSCRSP